MMHIYVVAYILNIVSELHGADTKVKWHYKKEPCASEASYKFF